MYANDWDYSELDPPSVSHITVRIHYQDDTSTVVPVLDDESIHDVIVRVCDDEGWDVEHVTAWNIENVKY